MKRFYIIVLVALNFSLFSCKIEEPIPGVDVDVDIVLLITNSSGENLLSQETIGSYPIDGIKLFYQEDAKVVEVYNPNLDTPRNFKVLKNEGNNEFFMLLFVNEGKGLTEETTITYLQLNGGDMDTIRSTITRPTNTKSNRSVYCDQVWYNDVLKYDVEEDERKVWGNMTVKRFIEIKK